MTTEVETVVVHYPGGHQIAVPTRDGWCPALVSIDRSLDARLWRWRDRAYRVWLRNGGRAEGQVAQYLVETWVDGWVEVGVFEVEAAHRETDAVTAAALVLDGPEFGGHAG